MLRVRNKLVERFHKQLSREKCKKQREANLYLLAESKMLLGAKECINSIMQTVPFVCICVYLFFLPLNIFLHFTQFELNLIDNL